MAGILILTGGDQSTPLAGFADDMKHALKDLSGMLKQVAEEVIQPAFGRNYDRSGLKSHNGLLKQALIKTDARGNYLEIRAMGLTAGLDYGALPYAKYVIEGRGDVYPRRAKALRFTIDGKVIFAKHARPAPPHDLVYLTPEDFERVATALTEKLIALGGQRLPK